MAERERQVLALYYYEELTMKEAGVILGLGESRVFADPLHGSDPPARPSWRADQPTPWPRGRKGGLAERNEGLERKLSFLS
jgi:hypothetical protein